MRHSLGSRLRREAPGAELSASWISPGLTNPAFPGRERPFVFRPADITPKCQPIRADQRSANTPLGPDQPSIMVADTKSVVSTEAPGSAGVNTNGVSESGIEVLPWAYQRSLRLRALGADAEFIAERPDMPVAGVAILLAIGKRKLQNAGVLAMEDPNRVQEKRNQDHE